MRRGHAKLARQRTLVVVLHDDGDPISLSNPSDNASDQLSATFKKAWCARERPSLAFTSETPECRIIDMATAVDDREFLEGSRSFGSIECPLCPDRVEAVGV